MSNDGLLRLNSNSYAQLLVSGTPMLDVRAPIEFHRGAFPSAVNLPILDDLQREAVGTCFKQHGQDKAIKKGHELVNGDLRESRIKAWVEFTRQHPQGSLYCFRGGLRSKITQQWLHESGIEIARVDGGYKALRSFLIAALDDVAESFTFSVVGGKTGCAKTSLIKELDAAVDLEGAAHHRGSSFGKHAKEQHTQINFENILAIDFLKLKQLNVSNIALEDESRTIGKVAIPHNLFLKMRQSSLIVVEAAFETRLEQLLQEYIVDLRIEFDVQRTNNAFKAYSEHLLLGLKNIQKRLGSANFYDANKAMRLALDQQLTTGETSGHFTWLRILLENYYDPLYNHALKKRESHIVFRGDYEACKEYLRSAK